MSENDILQQAYQMIRSGERTEAVKLLLPIVRADPENADAWWLLANAVDKSDQARRALQQVLKVRPNDQRARRFLEQLGGTPPPARTAPPPTTFDDDIPPAGATRVYQDDPEHDAAEPERDVWEDPFGSAASSRADDALRSQRAQRAVDPDLDFDDDPFAPDKPTMPLPPRGLAPSAKRQSQVQPRRQPARRTEAQRQPTRAQGSRPSVRAGSARRQRRPARPIALPGVEEFAEDPFAPDSKVLQPRRTIELPTILISALLLGLIVVALILALGGALSIPAGSVQRSITATLDSAEPTPTALEGADALSLTAMPADSSK